MTLLAATVLSGNSEALIRDAISSIVPWVDFVLLIDTGITDQTAAIVQELAGQKFRVASYPWRNDFAAARNFALQAAVNAGANWAVTVDTDERLQFPGFQSLDQLRQIFESAPGTNVWLVPYGGKGYAKDRIVRVPTHLKWSGRTHEALCGARAGERSVLRGSSFTEVAKTREQMARKHERDLAVLREEVRHHPKNARWWYYLGQTLEEMRRHGEAVDAYQKCAFLDGWDEESAWACFRASLCLFEAGKTKKALEMCAFGLARHPGFPELPWMAARCCLALGELDKARYWAEICAGLGNFEGIRAGEDRINFRHLPAWYEGPYAILQEVYERENDPQASMIALKCVAAKELRQLRA